MVVGVGQVVEEPEFVVRKQVQAWLGIGQSRVGTWLETDQSQVETWLVIDQIQAEDIQEIDQMLQVEQNLVIGQNLADFG